MSNVGALINAMVGLVLVFGIVSIALTAILSVVYVVHVFLEAIFGQDPAEPFWSTISEEYEDLLDRRGWWSKKKWKEEWDFPTYCFMLGFLLVWVPFYRLPLAVYARFVRPPKRLALPPPEYFKAPEPLAPEPAPVLQPEPEPPPRVVMQLAIPAFFTHAHVIGKSGMGKTSLLLEMIARFIEDPSDPTVVVIDSQGTVIPQLARLEVMQERGLYISPREVAPAINLFDLNLDRYGGYDEIEKERVVNGAIQTLSYLFDQIVGADLSGKQGAAFRPICRLLVTFPETEGRNATLLDMLRLLAKPDDFAHVIAKLPPLQREFFERDLMNPRGGFAATREQIRYRITGLLENPTFEKMLTASHTRLDLFTELNRGSIILIDTSKAQLKDYSPLYGCIFIALILQAIYERETIPERRRHPTLLVIDECWEYFKNSGGFFEEALAQCRKYRCGIVAAHHHFNQCTDTKMKSALLTNMGLRFVFQHNHEDTRALAGAMGFGANPELIGHIPQYQFAAHGQGLPRMVREDTLPDPLGDLPRMDKEEWSVFRRRNRFKLAGAPRSTSSFSAPPSSPEPEEDADLKPGAW